MQSRREFLKTAALLSGAATLGTTLNESILQAMAIDPEEGSTFLDAEHVVILMQENRSFDHCYGTLAGVRGFNDPRAVMLPNKNPVWIQTNADGESYAPFRLNMTQSNATWMGCLPHNWDSQVDARNNGHHDNWLEAKRPGGKHHDMPLTMGHYTREDIPFHYALADAFTVCDQYFCSSLTPTSPNRLHLWTGTIREKPSADSPACVRNDQAEHEHPPTWMTFPERLEDHGVSWKIYQNEVTQRSGFTDEQDAWLSNFGDNPMEYFSQYHVKFSNGHRDYLENQTKVLAGEVEAMKAEITTKAGHPEEAAALKERLKKLTVVLNRAEAERDRWSVENYDKLPQREKNLHEKAFATNIGDPAYRELADLPYRDGDVERQAKIPKGDILHQFRKDVKEGKLPAVSWLVAPAKLSDHPDCAWFGSWYVSETLSILTQNPDLWKKTIFILTYDENDGYFDHIPPFAAPHPHKRDTGFASKGIDTSVEYVKLEQEQALKVNGPRESPIGLGYRVPMVVASPWSRGGCVNSQVFDHTSVLQFLETLLTHKTGKPIKESNISHWRRTVSGDLTSIFQPAPRKDSADPTFLPRDAFFETIDRAKYKPLPSGYTKLTKEMIDQIRQNPAGAKLLPKQEPGVRPSCPLPYDLRVDGALSADRTQFTIRFEVNKTRFGDRVAGCPFTVYAITGNGQQTIRNYAVASGEALEDAWNIRDFEAGKYDLRVHGPNGFYREFTGAADDPAITLIVQYTAAGDVEIHAHNGDSRPIELKLTDKSYGAADVKKTIAAGVSETFTAATAHSFRWYDVAITIDSSPTFAQRFAGRVDTGQWSFTDPAMGRVAIKSPAS